MKEEVSLERLVELAGVELRRQGKDLVGLCPFHEERTGSLVISPEKNLWHCMGACPAGGSVIDWVMRAEGVSFRHAVGLLRGGVAPSALGGRRAVRSTVSKLPSPLAVGADEGELLERVAGFYAQTLRESPEAQGYLQRRGLADSALLERFRLGFANRTLGYRLPAKNRRAGAELRGKLQALGVLRGSGHEHLSGSLVVPVCDRAGRVVQLYGRKIRDDLPAGTPLHLYLPGPRRGVFNAEGLGAAGGELVVCESLIDALTFWANGLRHVTAAYGAEGLTDEQLAALKDAGVGRVLIAFDRDEAGDRGAAKLAERLGGDGVELTGCCSPPARTLTRSRVVSMTRRVRSRSCCARRCGWALARPQRVGRWCWWSLRRLVIPRRPWLSRSCRAARRKMRQSPWVIPPRLWLSRSCRAVRRMRRSVVVILS